MYPDTLVAEIPTNIQDIGTYFVLLEYDVVDSSFADGLKRITVDFDAFKIVCKSAYADTEGDMSLIGVIKVGLDGKSAYQYAQEHGYTGTEEEFGQLQTAFLQPEEMFSIDENGNLILTYL